MNGNADKSKMPIGSVLVVGGGIAGIQSSLDLADSGYLVYLLDELPSIGGIMAQLDKTFPTNDCAMWVISPKLVAAGRHPNIKLMTNSSLLSVEGEPGRFKASVLLKPRYIDPAKCTGCGECAKHCPISMPDTYNEGMASRKAIYVQYAQAVPLVYRIEPSVCIGCGLCERVCLAKAVTYSDAPREISLDIGSVILAPGYEVFDPVELFDYSYGRHPNVVTSLQFERILSASGPYRGHLLRPSDRGHPKKIAFLQCVGSRDEREHAGYCSSVCCMYAIKEAMIAKEHSVSPLDCAVFYMDIRAHGKDFDKYFQRAQEKAEVRFVRSKVFKVEPKNGAGDLAVKYLDAAGNPAAEDFDMVVLSHGFRASRQAVDLANRLRIPVNEYGFVQPGTLKPVNTARGGIFACGAFSGPKDIPESVTEASAAAAGAAELLASARGTMVTKVEYPPERDVRAEELRIGVFVCHCGINIANTVDVTAVREYAKTLPGVVFTEQNLYTCSQDAQRHIKEMIIEHKLNRVIVASCSPRTHEPIFRETVRQAGLNPYLFEMANIRDQCSWVHQTQPKLATIKAKRLVRMAVAKSSMLESLSGASVGVTSSALVIGGGIAGMTAALNLVEQGFPVFLIEKEAELGGNARSLSRTHDGEDVREFLAGLIERTKNHPKITVITQATVVEVAGFRGNFKVGYMVVPRKDILRLECGAVVVASGAMEHKPTEYLYGQHPRVITQLELEQKFAEQDKEGAGAPQSTSGLEAMKSVVMIQCVGSRQQGRMYCSRVCCTQAIKNALRLKELNPAMDIYVLYRDIRSYGFAELLYRRARAQGVTFIRYDEPQKPEVQAAGDGLLVKTFDTVLGEPLHIKADAVVLAAAIVGPEESNLDLSHALHVPLNEDHFFLEAHVKLRPVDAATDGVFLCGMAHSPKTIDESIKQANAAASRAATLLSKTQIQLDPVISEVIDANCDGCAYCVDPCPYKAITLLEYMRDGSVKKTVEVDDSKCQGCGTCQATCPKKGMVVRHFKLDQLGAMVTAALAGE